VADFFDMCDITERQANIELNDDPEVKAEKVRVANEAAEFWKSIAPVGDPAKDPHSGQYRDSIIVHEGKGVAVMATAPNAWFVEYGTNGIHESACRARTEAVFKKKYGHAPDEGGE
jgi:hypothetical protein